MFHKTQETDGGDSLSKGGVRERGVGSLVAGSRRDLEGPQCEYGNRKGGFGI